jgi:hypothetical protein
MSRTYLMLVRCGHISMLAAAERVHAETLMCVCVCVCVCVCAKRIVWACEQER